MHPLNNGSPLQSPIACSVYAISCAEAPHFNKQREKHSLLLAPWAAITERITTPVLRLGETAGWEQPQNYHEIAPYASVIARVGEVQRWTARMQKNIDWMCDAFAIRPPARTRQHTAALHWTSRMAATDAGPTPKLTPLSYRGPRGSPIVALSRRRSRLTSIIPSVRQGEDAMNRFPFASIDYSDKTSKHAPIASNERSHNSKFWKVCRLCTDPDAVDAHNGPKYDLWHVLFECNVTRQTAEVTAVRGACKDFIPVICKTIADATLKNSFSLSNTRNAGISHTAINDAVDLVKDVLKIEYDWDCLPGRWLIYTILLAVPFPMKAVRPDPQQPLWIRPMRKRSGVALQPEICSEPVAIPELSDALYALPEALGHLFDTTVLSNDALRPLADAWCDLSYSNLLRVGKAIRPLREAANRRWAIADNDAEEVRTSSAMSSASSVSSRDTGSEP